MSIDLKITVGQHSPIVIADVSLERLCDFCDATGYRMDRAFGEGKVFGAPVVVDCFHCKGEGVVPSKAGLDLLDFIARYTKETSA